MISLRSDIVQKVLGYFFLQQGAENYGNDLARVLHLESGNLTRKLLVLEKEGLLKSRWQGKQRYYSLNAGFDIPQDKVQRGEYCQDCQRGQEQPGTV